MTDPIDATEGQTMTLDPAEGGKARWKGTTAKERSEAARKASEARWGVQPAPSHPRRRDPHRRPRHPLFGSGGRDSSVVGTWRRQSAWKE